MNLPYNVKLRYEAELKAKGDILTLRGITKNEEVEEHEVESSDSTMIEKMMAEEAARRAEETTKAKKRGWSINLPNSTQTDLVLSAYEDYNPEVTKVYVKKDRAVFFICFKDLASLQAANKNAVPNDLIANAEKNVYGDYSTFEKELKSAQRKAQDEFIFTLDDVVGLGLNESSIRDLISRIIADDLKMDNLRANNMINEVTVEPANEFLINITVSFNSEEPFNHLDKLRIEKSHDANHPGDNPREPGYFYEWKGTWEKTKGNRYSTYAEQRAETQRKLTDWQNHISSISGLYDANESAYAKSNLLNAIGYRREAYIQIELDEEKKPGSLFNEIVPKMIQQICDPIKIESLSENEFKVYLNSPDHLTEVEKFNGHELSDWFKANPGFLPDDKVEEFNSTLGDAVMYTADILDVADILE